MRWTLISGISSSPSVPLKSRRGPGDTRICLPAPPAEPSIMVETKLPRSGQGSVSLSGVPLPTRARPRGHVFGVRLPSAGRGPRPHRPSWERGQGLALWRAEGTPAGEGGFLSTATSTSASATPVSPPSPPLLGWCLSDPPRLPRSPGRFTVRRVRVHPCPGHS